jgi:hypothetical protein
MTSARRRSTWLVPVALVLLAAVITVVVLATDRSDRSGDATGDDPGSSLATSPDVVAVTSDAPTYATLDDLVGASDVVLRGTVVAVERGRWFGSGAPGESRIQSRLITVDVDEVLAGAAPTGEAILVEEEGWLADGAPIVVDGAPSVAVGDDAIWFLVEGGDPELAAYVVVNGQGRYVVDDDGRLTGATGTDPLIASIEAREVDAFGDALRSTG